MTAIHNGRGWRWSEAVFDEASSVGATIPPLIGVLPGEGIGPEVIAAALDVLKSVEEVGKQGFRVLFGGPIGKASEALHGAPLSPEVVGFCSQVFENGGALLCGPGGGRFVYDLSREFDLYCKLNPLKVLDVLVDDSRLKADIVRGVDILIVRDNAGGVYQGRWAESPGNGGSRYAEQTFRYTEGQVREIVTVAVRLAVQRRGELAVVVKDGGVPTISDLWRDCAIEIASAAGIDPSVLNVDNIAYQLVQDPHQFDVVVAPNLFGDVLADVGSVLLGSRGLSFSGSFSRRGAAVYQTNHGAAYDLIGKDVANPVAQILSVAMLLRESFGLMEQAAMIERAVDDVFRQGWRTFDLASNRTRLARTRQMGELIAESVLRLGAV